MLISKVIYIFILALLLISNQAVANNTIQVSDNIRMIFSMLGYQPTSSERHLAIHYVRHEHALEDMANMNHFINYMVDNINNRPYVEKYKENPKSHEGLVKRYHRNGGTSTYAGKMMYAKVDNYYIKDFQDGRLCTISGSASVYDNVSDSYLADVMSVDDVAHEIGHCVFLTQYPIFRSVNNRYPGVELKHYHVRNRLKERNLEEGTWYQRYYIHVNEVFADIHSVLFIFHFTDYPLEFKMEYLENKIKQRTYLVNLDPGLSTHHTKFYLEYLRDNIDVVLDFDEIQYLRNPFYPIFDLMYKIGKDYSITEEAFYETFRRRN